MAGDVPRVDFDQRIGDTFTMVFSFRYTDGTLKSFATSNAVFHAQSGDDTIHYQSGVDPEVTIVDVADSDKGPGGVDCGVLVELPYTQTDTWTDEQRWFYEVEEWTDPSGTRRYTIVDGVITAKLGVVDGSD